MKTGFITILGRPNVGKSSLINALVGEKVSIVSPKAQTTRDRIMGILTDDECQMVFVDTPGVHKPANKLGEYMEKCVKNATVDTDVIVIVLDGTKRIGDADIAFIDKYLKISKAPVYVVVNKTDEASYEKIYPILDKISYLLNEHDGIRPVKDIIPTSAKKGKNVDVLKNALKSELAEGEMFFPADEYTDKSERYMICETVREKALMLLNDEIPHGIAVYIQRMFYEDNGVAHIICDIVVEKDSHKAIVIGKGGEKLKAIGERARRDIEKLLDTKVFMEMFVKVRDNWRNDNIVMNDVGYDPKNLK
ncbi:MAG: GTPase Era [Clostridiales bacterium]|nr:GTPase Era [Clostridiales bacterium]